MATTLAKTTSYAGEASMEYILKTFYAANSLSSDVFTIKENVSRPWKIRRLTSTGIIADKSCDFTPTGTVTIDERVLTPADLEVNLQLCKDDFKGDWDEMSMGSGAQNKSLPETVTEGMINEIIGKVGEDIERQVWQGDSSGADQFDGILTIGDADGSTVKIPGTAGGFAANVEADLAAIKAAAITAKIWGQTDFIIAMSPVDAAAYQDYLRSVGSGQENVSGDVPLTYNGQRIHVTYGLPTGRIVASRVSNLYMGTDLVSDANLVSLKDMTESDLSDNVRFKQVFTGGVQYGWSEELILYTQGA